jgi:hypothetical protein
MNDHSGSMKLIHHIFCSQSRFFMKQKKSRLLSFAWVILVLGLMIFTDTSNAGDGDDLVEAAYTGNLTKIHALLKKGVDVDYKDSVSETALMAASHASKGPKLDKSAGILKIEKM